MKFKVLNDIKKANSEQRNDWVKLQSSKAVWLLIAIGFALIHKTDITMLTFAFAGASNAKEQYKYSEKYTSLPKDMFGYIVMAVIISVLMLFLFPKMEELLNILNVSHFTSLLGVLVLITKILLIPVLYYFYIFLFEFLFGSIYEIINLRILKFLKNTKD